jgi:hypothetical protein
MKQYGKIALGVVIGVVALALAYAELTADAVLNAQLRVESESNVLHLRYGE